VKDLKPASISVFNMSTNGALQHARVLCGNTMVDISKTQICWLGAPSSGTGSLYQPLGAAPPGRLGLSRRGLGTCAAGGGPGGRSGMSKPAAPAAGACHKVTGPVAQLQHEESYMNRERMLPAALGLFAFPGVPLTR